MASLRPCVTRVSLALPGAVQTLLLRSAIKESGEPPGSADWECTGRSWGLGLAMPPWEHLGVLGSVICTAGHVAPMSSQVYHPRVWEKGRDSGMSKHLHSLMPPRLGQCRLNGSLWKFRQRKWSHYCTPAFFQVTGSLSGLDNLIIYYGLCGESLFKQGWNVLCWDIMFRLDMASNRLPKPVWAFAKGTWAQCCLAMCLTAQSDVLFSKGVHSSLTHQLSFQWKLTSYLKGRAPWALLEAQTSGLGQH